MNKYYIIDLKVLEAIYKGTEPDLQDNDYQESLNRLIKAGFIMQGILKTATMDSGMSYAEGYLEITGAGMQYMKKLKKIL